MPSAEKLLVFLASPGDVPTERRYVEDVVAELNRTVANDQGVLLQVMRWDNDAFPGYGLDAQALINGRIAAMEQYALFIGIIWNRLGTPTPRAESGTVEEFERGTLHIAMSMYRESRTQPRGYRCGSKYASYGPQTSPEPAPTKPFNPH